MRKGPILGPRTLHHSPWLSDGTDQPGRTRATVQLQEQSWGHTESPSATKPPGCLCLGLPVLGFVLPGSMWGYPTSGHHCACLCPMGRRAPQGPLAVGPPFWPKTCRMAAPSSAIPPQTILSSPGILRPLQRKHFNTFLLSSFGLRSLPRKEGC